MFKIFKYMYSAHLVIFLNNNSNTEAHVKVQKTTVHHQFVQFTVQEQTKQKELTLYVTPTMIDSLLTNYIKLLLLWRQNYNMATFVYIICEIFTCKF